MKNLRMILMAVVAIIFSATVAVAQEKPQALTLPSYIDSNMVLQHSTQANIWGWTKPNGKVTVACDWINGKPVKVKADAEGFWILPVQTLAPSYEPHTITIKSGGEVKVLENVVFGDVWLCSGQSNMQWYVMRDPEMKAELKNPANAKIRLYDTGRIHATTPQTEVPAQKKHKTQWSVCNPKALAKFSAVGYGFGKELQENLDIPIGLIDASYGGTTAEGWLSAEYVANAAAKDKRLAKIVKHSAKRKPHKKVSVLHNANIYPIRHATIAGVIWYQGCANVSLCYYYYSLLNHLVQSWRAEFDNAEMPFYIVQIAPHTYEGINGAIVRETQARVAAKHANCELVVTNDQNQYPGDIHPPKKADVAHRLAQCALGGFYGKNVGEFRSPAYESMVVEGNQVRVIFKNVPTKLVKKGEGRINGFQLGVKDPENEKNLIFSVAEARIEGNNTVVVSAEGVENPVAVRYCFNEDMGNVFSAEGLPLAPFRTDKSKSLSARPYVEKASEIAIKFEGEGYTRTTFSENAQLWEGKEYVMSNVYPKEFEGFELLVPAPVGKGEQSVGGTVTAKADGKIYLLAFNNGVLRHNGWTILTSTYTRCAKNGKLAGTMYIVEREVKAGEVIEIPKVKVKKGNNWGTLILAKSIEY